MHWFWFTIFIQGELETETGWRAVPDNTLETLAEQFRYFGEHMINPLPLGTCCDFSFNDSFFLLHEDAYFSSIHVYPRSKELGFD